MDKKYSNNKKKPHNKTKQNDKHQEVKSERREHKHERKDTRLDVSDKKDKAVVVDKKPQQQPQNNNQKGNNHHKHQANHNKNLRQKHNHNSQTTLQRLIQIKGITLIIHNKEDSKQNRLISLSKTILKELIKMGKEIIIVRYINIKMARTITINLLKAS
jgi:hypothetical protein